MHFIVHPSELQGEAEIPASKSHTIRAVTIAALADNKSRIRSPLVSNDTLAAADAVQHLGAEVEQCDGEWIISGCNNQPRRLTEEIDIGNSGTSLRLLMGVCGLLPEDESILLTGDHQIQKRPAGPLLSSLNDLGAQACSCKENDCAPVLIGGHLSGGQTTLEAPTSQFLSTLLMACPLADGESHINLSLLHEAAYVDITLEWLERQQIQFQHVGKEEFIIPGQQFYQAFDLNMPGDFSTATFLLAAGVLSNRQITCRGLNFNDSQPDRAIINYLHAMGGNITTESDAITTSASSLKGARIDMNNTPDALPMMAVVGCFAEGETILDNVPQARLKETDRIQVMATELRKLGADIEELEDGLIVRRSDLTGAAVNGHHDHRVVMALSIAGMLIPGTTEISTAEAASVTFPGFQKTLQQLGANIEALDS